MQLSKVLSFDYEPTNTPIIAGAKISPEIGLQQARRMKLYIVLIVLATCNSVRSAVVKCGNGRRVCNCPINAAVCEFTLKIEQRQTFTSYEFDVEGNLRGTGALYVLDAEYGYLAAIQGSNIACLFEGVILSDEYFTSRNCSVPITLDGTITGSWITINGISPGPTLVVDNDATVHVHVINDLLSEEATSIHWHGMYQHHTPWMDGVGHITQPSIQAGTSFDYIFQARPFGTHWYHSHVNGQRVEGMYGALVVRGVSPPNSTELVPEDKDAFIVDIPGKYTLTLFDTQIKSALDQFLLARTLGYLYSPTSPVIQLRNPGMIATNRGVRLDGSDNGPISFYSGIINGRGRFEDTIAPLSTFSVTTGKYFLFRIVGAMNREAYMFSIDGHTLRVIATDGKDIEHTDVEYISVESGERYDFLVHANKPTDNYWIRAQSLQFNVPEDRDFSARAIFSYQDAETLDWQNGYSNVLERQRQCSPETKCRVLNCPFQDYPDSSNNMCVSLLDLVPRPRKDAAELPKYPPNDSCLDCMYFLNFALAANISESPHSVNATTLELPPLPYQTYCGQYDKDNSADSKVNTCEKRCVDRPKCERCVDEPKCGCECINVIPLANQAVFVDDRASEELESIVMVFSSFGSRGSHPIHVHGHAFQVVHIGYGAYFENGTLDQPTTDLICDDPCTDPRWRDNVTPPSVLARISNARVTTDAIQKDTVVVPMGGYVVVAFNADNPGYWYIHCHIEDHLQGGMAAILQEYSPDQQWLPPPGINKPAGFRWSVKKYHAHIQKELMCSDVSVSIQESKDEACIEMPGFCTLLTVFIILAIMVFVLVASKSSLF